MIPHNLNDTLSSFTLFYVIWDSRLQNAVIKFGNIIIGDIAIDICTLEREIGYWTTFLTPDDGVRESFSLLNKHVSDLSRLATIQRGSSTYYGLQVHHHKIIHVLKEPFVK